MERTEFANKIHEALLDLGDELVAVWNEYCSKNNYMEDYVYQMYEFDEHYEGCTPTQIVTALADDFDINQDFFRFTRYGTTSFSDPTEGIDEYELDDLTSYIERTCDWLHCNALQEIIDEHEEETSEDED